MTQSSASSLPLTKEFQQPEIKKGMEEKNCHPILFSSLSINKNKFEVENSSF